MTIQSNGKIMVLAKNVRESRDSRNSQKFYNLAILINGEAGNISCTESAYNDAVIGKENGVIYAFNDQYKSFRIVGIVPESSVPDYATAGTNTDTKADVKAEKPSAKQ